MSDFTVLKTIAEKNNNCIEVEDLDKFEFNDLLLNFLQENKININDTIITFKGLSVEQEKHLFMSLEYAKYTGDALKTQIIRNKIMSFYFPLVGDIAQKYLHWEEYDDLFNQGVLGLINAIKHFDFRKGTRLITYAYKSIKNELQDYVNSYYLRSMPTGVPRRLYSDIKKISDIMHDYYIEHGEQPSDTYLTEVLEFDIERIRNIKCVMDSGLSTISYDAAMNDENEKMDITYRNSSIFQDKSNVEEIAINQNNSDLLKEAIDLLSDKEKIVIINHYGLFGKDVKTLKSISIELGVSSEWVRQIENKALIKIRYYLNSQGYDHLNDFFQ